METKPFWEKKTLSQMSKEEWERLCDGCARCCLLKIDIENQGSVKYTNVCCRLLDTTTCLCLSYQNRHNLIDRCIKLTKDQVEQFHWLPKTCAYRLISEGKDLYNWHPLISGSKEDMHRLGHSVINRIVSEEYIHPSQLPEHITDWE